MWEILFIVALSLGGFGALMNLLLDVAEAGGRAMARPPSPSEIKARAPGPEWAPGTEHWDPKQKAFYIKNREPIPEHLLFLGAPDEHAIKGEVRNRWTEEWVSPRQLERYARERARLGCNCGGKKDGASGHWGWCNMANHATPKPQC